MADTIVKTATVLSLEQVEGPGSGRIFEIPEGKFSIGRAPECDIVLEHESISRVHAYVEKRGMVLTFQDHQSKNGILVNGKKVAVSVLSPGDSLQIGVFVWKYAGHRTGILPERAEQGKKGGLLQLFGKRKTSVPGGGNRRVALYGGLGFILALAFFLRSPEPPAEGEKKAEAPNPEQARALAAPQRPELELGAAKEPLKGLEDPLLKNAEQQVEQLPWNDSGLKEAEQYFRKGQREYLSHNYHRAIENFQTALSLNRTHPLANTYLRLSIYEVEVEAKTNMELGVRYFESLQYSRAIYHFTEVVRLMSHRPEDPSIGEAEKYIVVAKRRMQAAEMLP